MKLRCDFVTNSSSSSFVLARKGGLSDRQKQAIINFVETYFLGEEVFRADSSDEAIEKMAYEEGILEDAIPKIKEAIAVGLKVYMGRIHFDYINDIATPYILLWQLLAGYDDEEHPFVVIDGDVGI